MTLESVFTMRATPLARAFAKALRQPQERDSLRRMANDALLEWLGNCCSELNEGWPDEFLRIQRTDPLSHCVLSDDMVKGLCDVFDVDTEDLVTYIMQFMEGLTGTGSENLTGLRPMVFGNERSGHVWLGLTAQ